MPYKDGNPTLSEQIEEDARRRFYTDDILKEANELIAENKRLRANNAELVEALTMARKCITWCRKTHPNPQTGDGIPVEFFIDEAIEKAKA